MIDLSKQKLSMTPKSRNTKLFYFFYIDITLGFFNTGETVVH